MALVYVGGNSASSTSNGYSVSLTALTGGASATAATGDIVIVCSAFASASDLTANHSITGNSSGAYTAINTKVWVNDTWDTVYGAAYKVMGGTADTSLTIGRSTDAAYGGSTVVHVWRGQHATTPIADQTVTQQRTNSAYADPQALTTVAAGDIIIGCGAGTQGASGSAFTVPTALTGNAISVFSNGTTSDIGVWIASVAYSGSNADIGTQSGGASSASSSGAAQVIALRGVSSSNYSLTCDRGLYALTGQGNTLNKTLTVTEAAGSYSFTGKAATLSVGRKLSCAAGSYSYTGQTGTLLSGKGLTAGSGSYSITGQAATFTKTLSFTASNGSYSVTGQSAALLRGMNLSAARGSYAATGQSTVLSAGRSLTCSAGSYALTGYDAGLTASAGTGNYSLTCDGGSYALSGQSSLLTVTTTPTKIGGDDAPSKRIEIWEKRKKPKSRDEQLERIIRESYDNILYKNDEPEPEISLEQEEDLQFKSVQIQNHEDHDEDDVEVLLLLQ